MVIYDLAVRIKYAMKAQPPAPPVSCENVRTQYLRWRIQVMSAMFIGYAIFYFCRKNLSMALPTLESELGISKIDLGIVLTLANLFYGVSKFVNGMLADHANPRYFMAFGLIASAVMNVVFGMSSMLWTLAIAWTLNGWFQGMGWPPCARQLTHWYHVTERGTWWGVWNASHQFGGAGIFILSGWLVQNYGWRSAFYIPAIIAFITAIIIMITMCDTPESLGLPPIDKYKSSERTFEDTADNESYKEILFKYVLKNKFLWLICLANFFVYIVRLGIMDWAPMFLHQVKGSDVVNAGFKVAGFEIAGIFGALCAGWMSDNLFETNRGKVNVLFMGAVVILFYFFWFAPGGSMFEIAGLTMTGFFIYGPQMLVGVSAVDFASKKAAATATGLTGLFGYFGASIVSGVGTGYIVDNLGWIGAFYLFVGSAVIATILFLFTWEAKATQ